MVSNLCFVSFRLWMTTAHDSFRMFIMSTSLRSSPLPLLLPSAKRLPSSLLFDLCVHSDGTACRRGVVGLHCCLGGQQWPAGGCGLAQRRFWMPRLGGPRTESRNAPELAASPRRRCSRDTLKGGVNACTCSRGEKGGCGVPLRPAIRNSVEPRSADDTHLIQRTTEENEFGQSQISCSPVSLQTQHSTRQTSAPTRPSTSSMSLVDTPPCTRNGGTRWNHSKLQAGPNGVLAQVSVARVCSLGLPRGAREPYPLKFMDEVERCTENNVAQALRLP